MQGTKLGAYEIIERLGKGGMGEVWLAQDTHLGRKVAIKVLPPELAADAERLARLAREARVLASLEHPNIAALYGLEEADGQPFLVMQLAAGETLSDRLQAGPLPVDEALSIAVQITEGLEAAHEQGIVHRDLKGANIMVAEEDGEPAVKLLDFGLAKASGEGSAGAMELTASPTVLAATGVGVLLGTAPYMSPEQARGKQVDRRTDIWAFGCVLYEMLTGDAPFSGETVTDVLAAVVRAEPDWSRLPRTTPAPIRELLARCLRKDLRRRLQHIGDARVRIREVIEGGVDDLPGAAAGALAGRTGGAGHAEPASWLGWAGWAVAAALLLVAGSLVVGSDGETPGVVRMVADLTGDENLDDLPAVALSPDGRRLVWVTRRVAGGRSSLWARELSELTPRLLVEGTGAGTPFFSPDGESIGFFFDNQLQRVPFAGGLPQTLAPVAGLVRGGSWSEQGFIVYAPEPIGGIWRVSDSGGEPVQLTTPDAEAGVDSHRWPQVLTGGRHVLYTAGKSGDFSDAKVAMVDFDTGLSTTLAEDARYGRYVSSGHVLFIRNGSLYAAALNPGRTALAGEPVPVVGQVSHGLDSGSGQYAVSDSGTLWYGEGEGRAGGAGVIRRMRDGGADLKILTGGAATSALSVSPDGSRLLEQRGVVAGADLWVRDLRRDVSRQLTFDGGYMYPIWTPDGRSVTYAHARDAHWRIYRRSADGEGEPQLLVDIEGVDAVPFDWSPDGTTLVFVQIVDGGPGDLYALRIGPDDTPGTVKPELLVGGPGDEYFASVSPDGRWLAYQSAPDASSRPEIFVTSFPDARGRWQLSDRGGVLPMWSGDSREVAFVRSATDARNGELVSVAIDPSEDSLAPSVPRALFDLGLLRLAPLGFRTLSGSIDRDEFFIVALRDHQVAPLRSIMAFGWLDELSRQVPAR